MGGRCGDIAFRFRTHLLKPKRVVLFGPVEINGTGTHRLERTFHADLTDEEALFAALDHVTDAAWTRIARCGACGRTATLKVRFADFHTITRARSLPGGFEDRPAFAGAGVDLLRALLPLQSGIRLLGLTLSGIRQPPEAMIEDDQPALPL